MRDIMMQSLLRQAMEDRLLMIQDGTKSAEDPDSIDYIAQLGYAYIMQGIIYGVGGDADGSEKVTAGECPDVEPMPKNRKADRHDKG